MKDNYFPPKAQNFFDMKKQNMVQEHINAKFNSFADKNIITMVGQPRFHKVKILASSHKNETVHMAVKAVKDGVEGFIVNVADKMLKFFTTSQVICKPVKDGTKIGKAIIHKDNSGNESFVAMSAE